MSHEELEKSLEGLPGALVLAGLSLLFLAPVLRWLRASAARRAGSPPLEPPLWGWREGLLLIVFWFLSQIAIGAPLISDQKALGAGEALSVALGSWALTLTAVVWLVGFRYWQPLAVLGLRRVPASWLLAVVGTYALVFIPLNVLAILWQWVLEGLLGLETLPQEPVEAFRLAVEAGDWEGVAYRVVAAALVAPLCEEVLFRGLLEGGLRTSWGRTAALWGTSLVFAAVHFSLFAFVPLLALGLILGWLRQTTGSLAPSIAFHALFNSVSLLLLGIVEKGPG